MDLSENPPRHRIEAAPTDSAPLLAALGLLAYAASMLTHEALGHGGFCLAAGGHNTMLTAWGESCSFPGAPRPAIDAAGPTAQFAVGLLAWLLLHRLPVHATRLRFFVWLLMAFSLFIASSYIAFSGITGIGDAAVLIASLHPPLAWRTALVLLGSALFYLSLRAAASELHRFAIPNHDRPNSPDSPDSPELKHIAPPGPNSASPRLVRLITIPYLAASLFACTSAARNHTMGSHVALGFAAASSFGSLSGLFALPTLLERRRLPPSPALAPTPTLTWSTAWATAAIVILALSLVFLGPGLE